LKVTVDRVDAIATRLTSTGRPSIDPELLVWMLLVGSTGLSAEPVEKICMRGPRTNLLRIAPQGFERQTLR
jgi:hypothetical protein